MGLILASLVAATPLTAQNRDSEARETRRAEIAERMRELTRELSDLQSEQMRMSNFFIATRPGTNMLFGTPLALRIAGSRARLGVVVQTQRDPAIDSIGALIESLTDDAPAEIAGLEAGDILVEFDGRQLTGRYPPASSREAEPAIKLIDLVASHDVGDTVNVVYRRDGRTHSTDVVLDGASGFSTAYRVTTDGGEDMAFIDMEVGSGAGRSSSWGVREFSGNGADITATLRLVGAFSNMELVSLNEDLGSYFGTTEGVLVVSAPDNELGLVSGDVILEIGGREVQDPSRVFRILGSYEAGEEVEITVMRHERREALSGTIPERSHGVYRSRTRNR